MTFKTLLEQQAHREQALRAMRTFVLLLDVEQLARGLQQLVMMLLPHLLPHTQLVVAVLEAVVGREEAGEMPEPLRKALGEVNFLPDHAALGRVRAAQRRHAPPPEMTRELRTCARLLSHESGAVRLLAVQQLLGVLRGATSTALSAQLLSPHLTDREVSSLQPYAPDPRPRVPSLQPRVPSL